MCTALEHVLYMLGVILMIIIGVLDVVSMSSVAWFTISLPELPVYEVFVGLTKMSRRLCLPDDATACVVDTKSLASLAATSAELSQFEYAGRLTQALGWAAWVALVLLICLTMVRLTRVSGAAHQQRLALAQTLLGLLACVLSFGMLFAYGRLTPGFRSPDQVAVLVPFGVLRNVTTGSQHWRQGFSTSFSLAVACLLLLLVAIIFIAASHFLPAQFAPPLARQASDTALATLTGASDVSPILAQHVSVRCQHCDARMMAHAGSLIACVRCEHHMRVPRAPRRIAVFTVSPSGVHQVPSSAEDDSDPH